MKTLRLNRAESTAYTNGERRFWRACGGGNDGGAMPPPLSPEQQAALALCCPYGKPGDRIEVIHSTCPGCTHATITAITVTRRDGKWGWEIQV